MGEGVNLVSEVVVEDVSGESGCCWLVCEALMSLGGEVRAAGMAMGRTKVLEVSAE